MIDTHCHIDLYKNPQEILKECRGNGTIVLSMTNLPTHFEMGFPFFKSQNKIRQALGMHPLYAKQHNREFPKFLMNLSKTSYIGEVGLDFSREGISTKEIQLQTFNKILNAVAKQNKILSIHSRKAEKVVLDLLLKYDIQNAIFHWYSGNLTLIDEIISQGYYFSINIAMTKSPWGRKIISRIPKQFILTETDGPFIVENNSPVKPGQVHSVINYLAEEWRIPPDDVQKIIISNFFRLIKRLG